MRKRNKNKMAAILLTATLLLSSGSMGVSAAEIKQENGIQTTTEAVQENETQTTTKSEQGTEIQTEENTTNSVELPIANIMDVDFTSGDATDQSEMQNGYQVIGTPIITESEELHKNIAHFDGSSAYLYAFDDTKYEKFTETATIECMFKYDGISASGEHDIFSNQQGGGLGLGLNDGKLTFFAHVGGGYKEPKATIKAGQWVHAVGVVDGNAVKLYVNGELVDEIAAEGGIKFTSSENAKNFIIGGDSNSSGGAESFAEGFVSFARVYDHALSAEEVAALNTKAFEGADLAKLEAQQINLGIVASQTAPSGGEMNVNLHINGAEAGGVDQITYELSYDADLLTYNGVQHLASGVTIDDSTKGTLKITYEGSPSVSDFSQYASTRIGKLNFKINEIEKDISTTLETKNFQAYMEGENVTAKMQMPVAEKTITIYAKDSLDLNGDGVVGAGDVALAKSEEQEKAIAAEAAIYPYKHAVILTSDGAGSVWDKDSIYYTTSTDIVPTKTSDPEIMAKRTNDYAMTLFNEEFATSHTAQAVTPSISGQNYSSIIHGIPWLDVDEEYQITNSSASSEYYPDYGLETAKYPSMFKAVQEAFPSRSLAAFAEWTEILNGVIEPDAGVIGKQSASKESFYDVADYIKSDDYMNTAIVYMQSDWLDHVGHSTGYYNDTFYAELKQYDDYFKAVVDALKETGTYEETLIIANADHGGSGTGHGSSDPSNMDVFIGLGGQTIDSGKELEGGDNADIAALALYALRIDKPETMTGEVFDTSAFLSQEEMVKKNRNIENITFTRTGKSATLSLANQKSETRVIDAVIDLDGAAVKNIDAGEGTILRQEVTNNQLKLTISYNKQPETLAKITFDQELSEKVVVNEIMLGTAEGKEIYPDLQNTSSSVSVDKTALQQMIAEAEALQKADYTTQTFAEVEQVLSEAKAIVNDNLAEQEEIDTVAVKLERAIKALEEIEKKEEVSVGKTFLAGSLSYKVTAKGKVTVTGLKKKTVKSVTIPAVVAYKGTKLKVTTISAKAFKNSRKLEKVTIGKNVTTIGKEAFYGDKNLEKVVIESKVLSKVGIKAIKGIDKKAVIKVPKSKVDTYKKLLKKAGLQKTMTLKK